MLGLGIADILAGLMVVALTMYVLLGGADFGGGLWDLLARGPRKAAQRELIADAIGPIWEANHVWLILVVVMLFSCFPPAFARFATLLHVPLAVMLVGIVLRGSAFTFRTYDSQRDDVQIRWGRTFAIASTLTPVTLGVCVGATISGDLGAVRIDASAYDIFIAPWATPFAFAVGAFTLALFAFLAAVYLTVEAYDDELRDDFRVRALGAGAAVGVCALLVLVLARSNAPFLWTRLANDLWALPVHAVTALAAITAFVALLKRRYRIARFGAVLQAICLVWGWAWAQFPYLLPPGMTISDAAAPEVTLRLVLIGLAVGLVVLVPSFWYLFRVFKRGPGALHH
jgi:cytochrome d ubiquinol oxidase subunit II